MKFAFIFTTILLLISSTSQADQTPSALQDTPSSFYSGSQDVDVNSDFWPVPESRQKSDTIARPAKKFDPHVKKKAIDIRQMAIDIMMAPKKKK